MPDRTFAEFMRWLDLAWPRAYGPSATIDPATRCALWIRSERLIAARLLLAAAREGAVDAALDGSSLVLRDRGEALALPLTRIGEFALHWPDLAADRPPALEAPDPLLDRIGGAVADDPAALQRLRLELADSVFNLAIAHASAESRRRILAVGGAWPAPQSPENLVVVGHPWHPMCKTRLGLGLAAVLRHAPENLSQGTLHAIDVDAALLQRSGDTEGLLPRLWAPARRGRVRLPVHAAQVPALRRLFPERWGRAISRAAAPPRAARALLSLRTVAVDDLDLHIKLSLSVITTSARRTVSPMSVANGPPLTGLLARIQARDPGTRGPLILGDLGAAGLRPELVGARAAHLGLILRASPDSIARAAHGDAVETWVSAALGARRPGLRSSFLAELAARHGSPTALLSAYVDHLVPPLLQLLSGHGVALEAHLQNTLAIVGPRGLVGFVLRDLGGVRLHRPRLAAAGHAIDLAPGSFLATDDLEEVRDKLAHTLFHAHLAALFRWVELDLGVAAREGWARVRAALDRHRGSEAAIADRQALVADRVRSKALLAMRIGQQISEYTYTRVDNVLARADVVARAAELRHPSRS